MNVIIHLGYLVSISLFILGLKFLSSPRTARRGNFLSMLGMFIAVVITLLDKKIIDYKYIIVGIVIGSLIGVISAQRAKMSAMPQMVAILNAFGGCASALVAIAQFFRHAGPIGTEFNISVMMTIFIGMITFTGSVVAFAKLEELIKSAPIVFSGQQALNALLILAVLALSVFQVLMPTSGLALILAVFAASSILGITLVIPIGGADMPVIIALLNSLSGLAASASGFVINNYVLIVSGALVGASGIILTNLMCRAMNRSLGNVLFGAVGEESAGLEYQPRQKVVGYSPLDAAVVLEKAQSIIVVPGYGMAVAQAQYVLHDTIEYLRKKGIRALYAIHPVAGRMPGHMNVLLAEANVAYDLLKDIDEVNEEFKNTDVVLVVGANDVINPAAREKGNALSGMPILNVDQAKSVIIIKRSLSPGFAGVDNRLFYDPKTMMIFGDAKEMMTQIINALKL